MSDTIRTRQVTVKAEDGEIKQAALQVCAKCKGEEFFIFTLKGDNHAHMQCTNSSCGEVYCHTQEHHPKTGDTPPRLLS